MVPVDPETTRSEIDAVGAIPLMAVEAERAPTVEPTAALDLLGSVRRAADPVVVGATATGRMSRGLSVVAISIAVVAILAGSALFVSGYALGRQAAAGAGTPISERAAFQPFWDTYQAITDRYAGEEVERRAVIEGAIRGMIASLDDPFSAYLSSEEYRSSLQGLSGQFEGIGAEIGTAAKDGATGCTPLGPSCRLVITRPIGGSPAEKAGLKAGDVIAAVDGTSVDGLTVDGARDRIRGPRGTMVTLDIDRVGAVRAPVTIARDVVQSKQVESRVLARGTVGYIQLIGFSDAAADELVEALRDEKAARRTNLILDLRGNPGGYITAARKIASQFVASGPVFWEQDAKGKQTPTMALTDGVATDPDLRIVVLIDGGTASASEIVAGALQDTNRATLVGQKSYGKGTMQQWQELGGEGGAFKLTIARWLTPDKRWIHKVGLIPDSVVELPTPVPAGTDPTLDRALEVLGATGLGPTFRALA